MPVCDHAQALELVSSQALRMFRVRRQRLDLVVPSQVFVEHPKPQHMPKGLLQPLA